MIQLQVKSVYPVQSYAEATLPGIKEESESEEPDSSVSYNATHSVCDAAFRISNI